MKTEKAYNYSFIQDCLQDAIKGLKKELLGNVQEFYLDRDTKGITGIPNIPTTLEEKIKHCDIFIADLTYIRPTEKIMEPPKRTFWDKLFFRPKQAAQTIDLGDGIPAPNVSQELGVALGSAATEGRIITILNEAYGPVSKLPFDLAQRRYPTCYTLDNSTAPETKREVKKELIKSLKEIIRTIYQKEHERQKAHFSPFVTWKTWGQTLTLPFKFEGTIYSHKVFLNLRKSIRNRRALLRLCGLPGIGKTRILYECFQIEDLDDLGDLTGKILYVDSMEEDGRDIVETLKLLIQQKEDKIVIIDNCTQDLHISVARLVSHENSQLRLITVSTNPEEQAVQLNGEYETTLLILENEDYKETVSRIIESNFHSEFDKTERELLVEFSSGLPLVATIMINNKDRGQYQPGSLHPTSLIQRLLGSLYDDPNTRSVIVACSLFSKIGFFDDLADQANIIALQEDLCDFSLGNVNPIDIPELKMKKFQEICQILHKHQLLERKGRTYALRPSPLAVRLAEEWWQNCTVTKFDRILPDLEKADLIESFCEQFRYLKHVEHAQTIVENLCDSFFSTAEVLNTKVGSRLFRTFVDVNPIACSLALSRAFGSMPTRSLINVSQGRRNLIWALERLCFRPETFHESSKMMAAFSVAENEEIGNNATNQFLQLFHIFLPGTSVDLHSRLTLLEYCLHKDSEHELIGMKAVRSAIKVDQFQRMGGAEQQGDKTSLQDYKPKPAEIKYYWEQCIQILMRYIEQNHTLGPIAAQILFDNFYAFCATGAAQIIMPSIDLLLKKDVISKMDWYRKIKFILYSKRVYDARVIKRLEEMLNGVFTPDSIEDKIEILVRNPTHDEYYPDGNKDDHGAQLDAKIDILSKELLKRPEQWDQYIPLWVSGHVAEGAKFGKALAKNGSTEQINLILQKTIAAVKSTEPDQSNAVVALSLLTNLPTEEQFKEYFNNIIEDQQIKHWAFHIARAKDLEFQLLIDLVERAEKKEFLTHQFSAFVHGWGLKHLTVPQIKEILERIARIDDMGKSIALMVLATASYEKQDVWISMFGIIRDAVLNNSEALFLRINQTMDLYYYGATIIKLLKGTQDEELAHFMSNFVVSQINRLENYHTIERSMSDILNVLQKEYFGILWPVIINVFQNTETLGLAAWHLKDLLGSRQDHMRDTEGLLFGGDPTKFQVIFNWCKDNPGNSAVLWLAEQLPIFSKDTDGSEAWHPYAKTFIDTFGGNKFVLNAIDANMGTFFWSGPISEKLISDRLLFSRILDHPMLSVQEWARNRFDSLAEQILLEKDKEEEGAL